MERREGESVERVATDGRRAHPKSVCLPEMSHESAYTHFIYIRPCTCVERVVCCWVRRRWRPKQRRPICCKERRSANEMAASLGWLRRRQHVVIATHYGYRHHHRRGGAVVGRKANLDFLFRFFFSQQMSFEYFCGRITCLILLPR